jgi:hypothetical protein
VGTKQLKKDAVISKKVKDGTLTAADVKAGTFATPANLVGLNAAKLGGIGPGGFLHGAGHVITRFFDKTANDDSLQPVPGGGAVALQCSASGYNVWFNAVSNNFDVFQYSYINGDTQPQVQHRLAKPGDVLFSVATKNPSVFEFDAQGDSGGGAVTVFTRFDDGTKHCLGHVRGLGYP